MAVEKLESYINLFANKPEKIELANIPPQKIILTDDKPVRIKNYQLAFEERTELVNLIKNLEKAGVVSRRPTRYESPVFLKKKPDGSFRLLVDYRVINSKIGKAGDRSLKIDDIWPYLRNKKYFTCLDLNSDYFQIPLEDESKEVTGINVEGINYVFNSIPQGLSCSPFIFQGIMNDVLYPLLREKVMMYTDDILIFGNTFEECLQNTIETLNFLGRKDFS